jgi:Na+/H+ antiporter NhaD/arsenite permease-like protein
MLLIAQQRAGTWTQHELAHRATRRDLQAATLHSLETRGRPPPPNGDWDVIKVQKVLRLNEREAIQGTRLLIKCGVVLLAVFTGFIGHSAFHLEPAVVALLGAGVLLLVSKVPTKDYMGSVEWQTLLFFAGLFVMVGALVKAGVIASLADWVGDATGGRPLLAVMLILVVSAVLSGIVDNIPYVATMSPVVLDLTKNVSDPAHALWWALAAGADFGGNATAIGASANVVAIGIALRAGSPISFWEFTRKGTAMTAITILVAAPYLWLRYFVLS